MGGSSDVRVLQEKLIGYYSTFDLNIEDWFTEFENMELFRLRVKNNLGKLLYLYQEANGSSIFREY